MSLESQLAKAENEVEADLADGELTADEYDEAMADIHAEYERAVDSLAEDLVEGYGLGSRW